MRRAREASAARTELCIVTSSISDVPCLYKHTYSSYKDRDGDKVPRCRRQGSVRFAGAAAGAADEAGPHEA